MLDNDDLYNNNSNASDEAFELDEKKVEEEYKRDQILNGAEENIDGYQELQSDYFDKVIDEVSEANEDSEAKDEHVFEPDEINKEDLEYKKRCMTRLLPMLTDMQSTRAQMEELLNLDQQNPFNVTIGAMTMLVLSSMEQQRGPSHDQELYDDKEYKYSDDNERDQESYGDEGYNYSNDNESYDQESCGEEGYFYSDNNSENSGVGDYSNNNVEYHSESDDKYRNHADYYSGCDDHSDKGYNDHHAYDAYEHHDDSYNNNHHDGDDDDGNIDDYPDKSDHSYDNRVDNYPNKSDESYDYHGDNENENDDDDKSELDSGYWETVSQTHYWKQKMKLQNY